MKEQQMQGEREVFEAWAKNHVDSLALGRNGGYAYADASRAWKAWQARAALAQQPATQAAGLTEAAAALLDAVEQELSPEWDCASYHPTLRPAAARLRALLSRVAPNAQQAEQPASLHAESVKENGETLQRAGAAEATRFPVVCIRAKELADALELAAPDALPSDIDRDHEQMDTELCIGRLSGSLGDDGRDTGPGLFAWYAEYPEEGVIPLRLDSKVRAEFDADLAASKEGA